MLHIVGRRECFRLLSTLPPSLPPPLESCPPPQQQYTARTEAMPYIREQDSYTPSAVLFRGACCGGEGALLGRRGLVGNSPPPLLLHERVSFFALLARKEGKSGKRKEGWRVLCKSPVGKEGKGEGGLCVVPCTEEEGEGDAEKPFPPSSSE